MRKRLLTWMVLCLGQLGVVWTYPTVDHSVGLEAPGCEHKGEVLFCDYKDAELVYMKFFPLANVKKVFLYNIKKLQLSEPVCVNVSLHNIQDVVVTNENTSNCTNTIELSGKNAKLDRIPVNADKLYLEQCEVGYVSTESELSKLSVISSKIKMLDLKHSLQDRTNAVLQESHIDTLQKLIIDHGSNLLIQKSTISSILKKGLEVKRGKVVVKDSTIKAVEGSVYISSGSSLSVGNFQGDMTITAESATTVDKKNVEPGTAEPTGQVCEQNHLPVILVSILAVLSWVLYSVYHFRHKISCLKPTRNEEPNEDANITKKDDGELCAQSTVQKQSEAESSPLMEQGNNVQGKENSKPKKKLRSLKSKDSNLSSDVDKDGESVSKDLEQSEKNSHSSLEGHNAIQDQEVEQISKKMVQLVQELEDLKAKVKTEEKEYINKYENSKKILQGHEEKNRPKELIESYDARILIQSKEIGRRLNFLNRLRTFEMQFINLCNQMPITEAMDVLGPNTEIHNSLENIFKSSNDNQSKILQALTNPDYEKKQKKVMKKNYDKYMSVRISGERSDFKLSLQEHYQREIETSIDRTHRLLNLIIKMRNNNYPKSLKGDFKT